MAMTEKNTKPQTMYKEPLTSHANKKIIGLGVVTLAVHVAFWFFFGQVLAAVTRSSFDTSDLATVGLTFILFLGTISMTALLSVLVQERRIARGILVLCALSYLAIFGFSSFTIVAVLLLILGVLFYEWSIKRETADRVRFSVGPSAQAGLGLTITIFLIVLAVTFQGALARSVVSGSTTDALLKFSGGIVNKILSAEVPNYDQNETLDTFLSRVIATQADQTVQDQTKAHGIDLGSLTGLKPDAIVEGLGGVPATDLLNLLPADVQSRVGANPQELTDALNAQANSVYAAAYTAMRDQVIAKLGVTATGSTPVGEIVNKVVAKNLQPKVGAYAKFIPSIFAVSVFLLLQIFSFLYAWIVVLLALFFFTLLKATGFVHLEKVEVEQERPVLTA